MSYKVNYRGDGRGVYRDYHCNACDSTFEKRLTYQAHKEFEEGNFVDMECPACDTRGYVSYRPSMPTVMNAAIPDGANKSEALRDLREASKLELQKANLPVDQRGAIQKEIDSLKSTKDKRREKENRSANKFI